MAEPRADRGPPIVLRNEKIVYGVVRRKLLTPRCKTATRHKPRDDCVPSILFLPISFHGAVKRREHPTPDTEVTASHRGARLDD